MVRGRGPRGHPVGIDGDELAVRRARLSHETDRPAPRPADAEYLYPAVPVHIFSTVHIIIIMCTARARSAGGERLYHQFPD